MKSQSSKRSARSARPARKPSALSNAAREGFLTTEQVIEDTGIPRETLFAWVRKGYIEKPRKENVPDGRGRRALWWPHVVATVKELRAITARGIPAQTAFQQIVLRETATSPFRYDEIYRIAQQWAAPASAGDVPERLALEDTSASLKECFIFAVSSLARLAGLGQEAIARVEWSAGEQLVPALTNLIMGHDPVLIVAPDGSFIAPRAGLGEIYGPRHQDDPDEWIALVAQGFTSPSPHDQQPLQRWFPSFTCLDLGPTMRTLWARWEQFSKPLALLPKLMRYEYAQVVWHRVGDEYFENDAVLQAWAHQPPAYVLDVSAESARPLNPKHPRIRMDEDLRWSREHRLAQLAADTRIGSARKPS